MVRWLKKEEERKETTKKELRLDKEQARETHEGYPKAKECAGRQPFATIPQSQAWRRERTSVCAHSSHRAQARGRQGRDAGAVTYRDLIKRVHPWMSVIPALEQHDRVKDTTTSLAGSRGGRPTILQSCNPSSCIDHPNFGMCLDTFNRSAHLRG